MKVFHLKEGPPLGTSPTEFNQGEENKEEEGRRRKKPTEKKHFDMARNRTHKLCLQSWALDHSPNYKKIEIKQWRKNLTGCWRRRTISRESDRRNDGHRVNWADVVEELETGKSCRVNIMITNQQLMIKRDRLAKKPTHLSSKSDSVVISDNSFGVGQSWERKEKERVNLK